MFGLNPYALLGGVAALAIAAAGGFYSGSQHEHRTHVIREAKAVARIEAARARLVTAFNAVSGQLATDRQTQDQSFTGIRRDAAPIILRPIYNRACLDGDGVGLLDRARDAANGQPAGQPADGTGPIAGVSKEP